MKTGKLIPLSVQEVLECCPDNSSWPGPGRTDWVVALRAIRCMGGIESEKTYPFRGEWNPWKPASMHCRFDESRSVAKLPSLGWSVTSGEFDAAFELFYSGPLANHMNAAARSFQFYSKGKYQHF